jgi:hypothetical protein
MPVAAAIIAGVIGIGTAVAGGVISSNAQDDAMDESKKLANRSRADQLSANAAAERERRDQLALFATQHRYDVAASQEESDTNRAILKEQTEYNRKQDAYVKAINMVNSNYKARDLMNVAWGNM